MNKRGKISSRFGFTHRPAGLISAGRLIFLPACLYFHYGNTGGLAVNVGGASVFVGIGVGVFGTAVGTAVTVYGSGVSVSGSVGVGYGTDVSPGNGVEVAGGGMRVGLFGTQRISPA